MRDHDPISNYLDIKDSELRVKPLCDERSIRADEHEAAVMSEAERRYGSDLQRDPAKRFYWIDKKVGDPNLTSHASQVGRRAQCRTPPPCSVRILPHGEKMRP